MENVVSYWYKGVDCQAPGLFSAEVSEIVSSSVSEELVTESTEEPDLDLAYDQLEEIKQRLLFLRSKLVYTPPDPCELDAGAASLSDRQLQLHQLRQSNLNLRCQLQRYVQHLYTARKQLSLVQDMRCQLSERLNKMRAELDKLAEFKASTQHQYGLCIERNEQIKTSKIDTLVFLQELRQLSCQLMGNMQVVVPLHCHLQMRYDFTMELIFVRIFLHTLYGVLQDDWQFCMRRLKNRCPHQFWLKHASTTVQLWGRSE